MLTFFCLTKDQLWMKTFGQNKNKLTLLKEVFLEYSQAFDSHNYPHNFTKKVLSFELKYECHTFIKSYVIHRKQFAKCSDVN